jgi:hypothetical protein
MANRPLDLTQRQIRAICEGAKKAGYAPVLEIGKVIIRLVPEHIAVAGVLGTADQAEEEDINLWPTLDGPPDYAKQATRLTDVEKARMEESRQFRELSEDERRLILKREYDEWAGKFRLKALGKKEWKLLDFLCENMPQRFPTFRTVKGCGDHTIIRLQARGFVAASRDGSVEPVEMHHYWGDHADLMWATPEGHTAWLAMKQ